MDYGKLLGRAWTILLENKYLLVLGILVALTGGNTGSSVNYQGSSGEFEEILGGAPIMEQFEAWMGVAAAAVVGLICIAFVVFLLLWAVSQVASGGLIAAVETIEDDKESSLGESWRAGWHRKWTLIGIGLVLFIPILLLILIMIGVALILFGAALGDGAMFSENLALGSIIAGFIAILCIAVPVILLFNLWSALAYRACMLEETGVWASYRRAWRVLLDNIGPVLIIILIRIGVGIVLLVPTFIVSLICLLWPVLLVLQGAVTAYFSTVWTLAWREWTNEPPTEQPAEALEVVQ